MRTTMLSLSLLAAPLMVACGDDEPNNPDARTDAQPIDSLPPDAPHVASFDDDEGGELRVEYLRFINGGTGTRVTGFLWKNPGATKYHEYVNLNGCTNTALTGGDREKWPFKLEADRQYADPGSIVISNPTSATNSFFVPRSGGGCPTTAACDLTAAPMPARDPFGRVHVQNQWFFKGPGTQATPLNDGNLLPPKTHLNVTFTGGPDVPPQTFEDVLYIPADFEVQNADGTAQASPYPDTAIPAGQPLVVKFENTDDSEPTGFRIDSLVAFTGGAGPAVVCIEPKDGEVTVPAAMIDVARAAYGNGGTFARQTLTHVVRELVDNNGPTGRRIDFISVWCYATNFTVPN